MNLVRAILSMVITIGVVYIVANLVMSYVTEDAHATDIAFVGDAQCGSMANQTIESIDVFNQSDLCAVGSPGNKAPKKTDTGWIWECADTAGHFTDTEGNIAKLCSANAILPKEEVIENLEELEEIEEIIVEVAEETTKVEEVAIVSAPEPIVRAIPTPVYTPVVTPKKKKDSGTGKDRNKHEWFEHECQIDRDDATWDYSRRSVNEIKTRCRAEVAVCPIRSLR